MRQKVQGDSLTKRIFVCACLLLTFTCAILASGQTRKRGAANRPPEIKSFTTSRANAVIPCYCSRFGGDCSLPGLLTPKLATKASDPDGDALLYKYAASAGLIVGEGAEVEWNLARVAPGSYKAEVTVDDQHGGIVSASVGVTVLECSICDCPCPTLSVSRVEEIEEGQPLVLSLNVSGGEPDLELTYNWTVSSGTIIKGQGTPEVEVNTAGLAGRQVTATVEVKGLPPECDRTESCQTLVRKK